MTIDPVWPIINRHPDPMRHFGITFQQWRIIHRQAADQGLTVVGIGHTHPAYADPYPSVDDLWMAEKHGFPCNVIYHTHSNLLAWYDADGVFATETPNIPLTYQIAHEMWAKEKRANRQVDPLKDDAV